MHQRVFLFLSAVSAEFKSYRDTLRHDLDRPNVTVKVQEDFIHTGTVTLEMLDDYIKQCDAVIHLVGDMTGAMANTPSVNMIRARYPDFGQFLPPIADYLQPNAPSLSYTQWEAWLALYHRKPLIMAIPAKDANRDETYAQTEAQRAQQDQHLVRLKTAGFYPFEFANADRLAVEVLRSKLHEILAKAGVTIKPWSLPETSIGTQFMGRDSLLDEICQRLGPVPDQAGNPTTTIVLSGLGGIGKTRLTLEYAWRRVDDYTARLFVGADTPMSLQSNLANLSQRTILDLPEQSDTDELKKRDAVVNWLNQHPGWLLILDNVDTPAVADTAEDLLAQLIGGHILVTSRLSNFSNAVSLMPVDVLAEPDAAEFLLKRTHRRRRKQPDDSDQATLLAKELGYLPLALEQAGAYLTQRRLSFTAYLKQYAGQTASVLGWYDPRLMQYPRSVAITWQTSFDQLSESARHLLQRLAWLSPAPIPEALLDVPVPDVESEEDLWDDLTELDGYSLVNRSSDSPSFTLHKLVQQVTRQQTGGPEDNSLQVMLSWLNAAFTGDPQDVRNWPVLDPLVPHTLALVAYTDERNITDPTSRLMNQLGLMFLSKALYQEAEPLMQRALCIDEASYGQDHPKVAVRLNNLAQLLQATNRLAEAEPLMKRALSIDEASFGKDHPNVARDLNNLALLLKATNRLAEAEPLMKRALSIDEASFGKDHPNVATRLNNLAKLLQDTNRLADAEPLMQRGLSIDEASFGKDHPKVARDLNNLALLLKATNRLTEAEPLMKRAVLIFSRSYGNDHPSFETAFQNYLSLGKAMGWTEEQIIETIKKALN